MYPHSRWGAAQCAAALACFLAVAVAQQGSQPTTRVAVIVARGPSYKNQLVYVPNMQLNAPRGLAFRPGSNELWVVNGRSDSVTIITNPGQANQKLESRQDAYGEHFTAVPADIAFSRDASGTFAIAPESKNDNRNITFIMWPGRNKYFKGNGFMGPILFKPSSFGLVFQNKAYMGDWPQGSEMYGSMDPITNTTTPVACTPDYYPPGYECTKETQGSHLDMLHQSPLSHGIEWLKANSFFVLDGCGRMDYPGHTTCASETGSDHGHLVLYDFNNDHAEGKSYHGDGYLSRWLDVPFKRVPGVMSGMWLDNSRRWLYYSNTGAGQLRRVDITSGEELLLIKPWLSWYNKDLNASAVAIPRFQYDWSPYWPHWTDVPADLAPGPADSSHDGEDHDVIEWWVNTMGDKKNLKKLEDAGKASRGETKFNGSLIMPRELTYGYAAHLGAKQEVLIQKDGWQPAGIDVVDGLMFVADAKSGQIAAYDMEAGFRQVWSYGTGTTGLQGVALQRVGRLPSERNSTERYNYKTNALLFYTDSDNNHVMMLELPGGAAAIRQAARRL